MNHRGLLVLPLLLMMVCVTAGGAAQGLRKFEPGSLRQIQASHAGAPFLLVFWSVTCAPCRAEFEMLETLREQRGAFPLVLVATDGLDAQAMAREMLQRYQLEDAESWIFADPDAQRLRFEIDPTWYGEMPRSYLYDSAHAREAFSGGLDRQRVEDWLKAAGF